MDNNQYSDVTFHITIDALNKLREQAEKAGVSIGRIFRNRAFELLRNRNPRFRCDGKDPGYKFLCGVGPETFVSLIKLAGRYGLPPEAVGQMVMSYVTRAEG